MATAETMNPAAQMDALRTNHGMWFPGDELYHDIASPTPTQLQEAFTLNVMPGHETITLEGSLGVLTIPREQPKGYAIFDLDDTFNDLCGAMHALHYGVPNPITERESTHNYGHGTFFTNDQHELKNQLFALVRASEIGVPPVAEMEEIRHTIANWRAHGIYTGFITSQTPGSELHTVNNFIGRYFAGNCDFLVIPEGHYTVADKGTAAKRIMELWGYDEGTPVFGIDDIAKNTKTIRTTLQTLTPQPQVLTVQPDLPSHLPKDEGSFLAETTRHGLDYATDFFAAAFGRAVLNTNDHLL
jgi:hypothetical protein